MDKTTNFKDCYKYSDVCARIIGGGDLDTIGRASCWGRVENLVVAVIFKKKNP